MEGDKERLGGEGMKSFYENEIKERLNREEKYREFLFPRCYFVTDAEINDMCAYPLYGQWRAYGLGKYQAFVQNKSKCYTAHRGSVNVALIGHAFDPFTGELSEEKIAVECLEAYIRNCNEVFDIVNRITGVFVLIVSDAERILAVQDCAGMQMVYYGICDGKVWLSSSPQLIADMCGLKRDTYVVRLLNSKSYYRGSRYLPGNLSPYKELTRLGANMYVIYDDNEFRLRRFFPLKERQEYGEENKQAAIEEIYKVFRKTIEMILEKWDNVALSLSGGIDSKTTLACANGLYDRFICYSYASKKSEKADADAAKDICEILGIKHTYYEIPEDPAEITDYDFLSKLIDHNTSYLMRLNSNELRKYIWFSRNHDFAVEIKSDSSEIGRAIMQRKYFVRLPNILAPRHFSIFQARYFLEPGLMRLADKEHKRFMEQTGLVSSICGYEHINLFFWEVRLSSWYATSFYSQQFYNEIVIPYNNRRLMDMFYGFSYNERLNDVPHLALMRRGNSDIADMNISVKDTYFGKKRMILETLYYLFATRFNSMGSFTRQ